MFKEVHLENIEALAGAPQIAGLLAHYRSLCSGDALPTHSKFNPELLSEHASNLAVVQPVGEGDYLYIYYGRTIFQTSGVEMMGSRVSQWKSEVGAFFCEAYDLATAKLRPVYTLHRAHHATRVHLWERLIMPVREQDGSLRLVVFNRPREYLDDLLRAILDASPEGVFGLRCVRAANGRIEDAIVLTANQRAADIIGCGVQDLTDRAILDVIPELRTSRTWGRYVEVVETRRPQRFELFLRRASKWFDVNVVPLGDGFIVSMADVTTLKVACSELESRNLELSRTNDLLKDEIGRRRELEGELRRLAEVDVLTGVATRRAFMDATKHALALPARQSNLALVALDVDHFKAINDRYGHLGGDKVLSAVGHALKQECRAPDLVGRIGGEEFAVLLRHSSVDAAIGVAERMRGRVLNTAIPIGDAKGVSVTASFGVAEHCVGDSCESLLARADAALYEAKRLGRNRVIAARDPDPLDSTLRRAG
jgi:diguanylate cyclase (GGDEF)-like protein